MRRIGSHNESYGIKGIIVAMIALIVIMQSAAIHKGIAGHFVGDLLWNTKITNIGTTPNQPAIGDVNGDGSKEIIISSNNLYCYSSTGTILWTTGLSSPSIPVLAQVDQDNALEILTYSSSILYCLKGIDGSIKWQASVSPSTIQDRIAVVDADQDNNSEIFLSTNYNQIFCFYGNNGTRKWSSPLGSNMRSPIIGGVDKEGNILLYAGSTSGGNLSCMIAKNGSKIWTTNFGNVPITPLAACDPDSDGTIDLVVKTSSLACIRGSNGTILWQSSASLGFFDDAVIGDVNRDGFLEIMTASSSSAAGNISCVSESTGILIWQTNVAFQRINMQLADFNDDHGWEISYTFNMVSGLMGYSGFGGISGTDGTAEDYVSFQSDLLWGDFYEVYTIAIADMNGDGMLETICYYRYHQHVEKTFNDNYYLGCFYLSGKSWAQIPTWSCTAGSILHTNAYLDNDKDGVSTSMEQVIGTNPTNHDTDRDGYSDGEEITHFTNPLDPLDPIPTTPVVMFTANSTIVELGQAVQFNYTGAKGVLPTTFSWNFGDGSANSSLQNPVHSYNTAGVYNVSVSAIDSNENTSILTKKNYITVLVDVRPIANFTATPTTLFETQSVHFTDLSNDPDGTVQSWRWNFGDGTATSTVKNPVHAYNTSGTYNVTLVVVDNRGKNASLIRYNYVTVLFDEPPIANFTSNKNNAKDGQSIQFFDLSTDHDNTIVSWQWDFGDGSAVSTATNPVHIYSTAGSYTVTLTVHDNIGKSNAMTKKDFITIIYYQPPVVNFTCNNTRPREGQPVHFFDLSSDPDGTIASWRWNFGDGTASTTIQDPVHVYATAGTYVVMLTVLDDLGGNATFTRIVHVTASIPEGTEMNPGSSLEINVVSALACIGAITAISIGSIVVLTRKRYWHTNKRIGNLLQSTKMLASDPGQPATAKQRALIASLLAEGRRTQLRMLPNEGLKQVSNEFARITSEPPLLARQRVLGEIETLKFMLDGDDLDAALHQAQSIVARLRLMAIDGQYSAEFKETMHGVASDIKRVIMAKLEHGRSGIGKQATTRALKARAILALLDDAMFTAGTSRAIDEFVPKGPVI